MTERWARWSEIAYRPPPSRAEWLEWELRRQLRLAGMWLGSRHLTADDAEELLVWLDAWTSNDKPRERYYLAWVCSACGHHFPVAPGEHERVWEDCTEADCVGRIIEESLDDTGEWHELLLDSSASGGPSYVLPIVRPLLDTPAGFELVRKVWCPRCDRRDGDPLGARCRPRCEIVPPPPELEIGPGCQRARRPFSTDLDPGKFDGALGRHEAGKKGYWWQVCAARRLYRWGLRRVSEGENRPVLELSPQLTDLTVQVPGVTVNIADARPAGVNIVDMPLPSAVTLDDIRQGATLAAAVPDGWLEPEMIDAGELVLRCNVSMTADQVDRAEQWCHDNLPFGIQVRL